MTGGPEPGKRFKFQVPSGPRLACKRFTRLLKALKVSSGGLRPARIRREISAELSVLKRSLVLLILCQSSKQKNQQSQKILCTFSLSDKSSSLTITVLKKKQESEQVNNFYRIETVSLHKNPALSTTFREVLKRKNTHGKPEIHRNAQ